MRMIDAETIKAVTDAVKPIAESLGQGADFYYKLAIKQSIVEGWIMTSFGSFFFLLFTVGLVWFMWKTRKGKKKGEDFSVFSVYFILQVLPTFFLVMGILRLYNPEYYAISDIISKLQGVR